MEIDASDVHIENVKIISTYGQGDANIKCQLSSVEEQRNVLRHKSKLAKSQDPMINRIFLRPSKSQEQRNLQAHTKIWLQETGLQSKYLLLDSGRLVRKRGRGGFHRASQQQLDTDDEGSARSRSLSPLLMPVEVASHLCHLESLQM